MPVHFAGRPVDMDRLNALRDAHGLKVVEDAAHALGAPGTAADRQLRQPHRLLVLRDQEHHDLRGRGARQLRRRDRRGGRAARAARPQPGRLAALLRRRLQALRGRRAGLQVQHDRPAGGDRDPPAAQARRVDRRPRRAVGALRRAAGRPAARYAAARRRSHAPCAAPLHGAGGAGTRRARATSSRSSTTARSARACTTAACICTPYYRDTLGVRPEDLPVASDVSERTLSLPFGPKVTEADQDDVVAALAEALA